MKRDRSNRAVIVLLWALVVPCAAAEPPSATPTVQPLEAGSIPRVEAVRAVASANEVLAAQSEELVSRLMEDHVVVLTGLREDAPLEDEREGSWIVAYVIFELPIERSYELLSQSTKQLEFRTELKSIETVELTRDGNVDEQRMRILFSEYVYYIRYVLDPSLHRIEWHLDERFENDLERVHGFWELYPLPGGRTLGRSGTSVSVGAHVPDFVQDWITRRNVPKALRRVRLWVDSEGRYRP